MRGSFRRAVVCALVCTGLSYGLASAPVFERCASAQEDDADLEAARVHYEAGEQHYLRGRYKQAIAEFEEAYRLSKRPELLFNLSQAYERDGDIKTARKYLRAYLDSGAAAPSEIPVLKDRLRTFDERIAASEQQHVVPPEQPPPPPPPRKRPFRTWKYVAGGTGVALIATSIGFSLDSASMSDKLESAADGSRMFDGDLQDAEARGQRDEVIAWITGVAGVAAVGVGVALFVLDARGHEAAPQGATVVPVVTPDGAGAALRWTF